MDNRPTKKRRQKQYISMGINNDDDNVVDLTITTGNSPLSLSARGSASATASAAISTQRNTININNGRKRCRFDITTDEHGVISLLDDSSDDNDDNSVGKLPPSSYNAKKRSRNQLPDDDQIFICYDDDDADTGIDIDIDTDLKKSSGPTLLVATGSSSAVASLVNEPIQPTSPPHNNDSTRREHRAVHQSSPFATVAESYLDTTRNSLTHEEKTRNYDDARRPQENLYKDLNHLIGQRKILIRGGDVELHNVCQGEINRIRGEINIARKNAREDIFHANNSAGGMGIQIDQGDDYDYDYDGSTTTSRINIDLHGQYVEDAKILFDEKVMPVLPVQKRIGVVTGRGKHSKTTKGQSKLRTGLVDHIRRMEDYRSGRMRYRIDPRNKGRLLVEWIGK